MIFETLAFIIGLVYGYAKPGKEDRWGLLKTGAMYGLILGVIFGIIGFFVEGLFLFAVGTTLGIFMVVIFLTIVFIVGTFIGDVLEGILKKENIH